MAAKSKRIKDMLSYLTESVPDTTPVGGAAMQEGDVPSDVTDPSELELDPEERKKRKKRGADLATPPQFVNSSY